MFRHLRGFRHGEDVGHGDLVFFLGDPVEGEQGMADGNAAGVPITDPGVDIDGRALVVLQPGER